MLRSIYCLQHNIRFDKALYQVVGRHRTMIVEGTRRFQPSYAQVVRSSSSKPQAGQHDGFMPRPLAEQPAHFRREQPQHTSTTTPPASLTLLELLHHAPVLSQVLSPDAWKALSAANRSLREYFVSQIQIVTVTCAEDAALVLRRAWPLLSMVIVQNSYYCGDDLGRALADKFELVAGAAVRHMVDNGFYEPAAVLMLRPRHTFASESAGWPTSAAQQLASQITVKFPKLREFEFISYASTVKGDLAALSLATIAQITKRNWSSLIYVSLNRCGLDSAAMALLAKGNWPMLKIIQLSSNPGIDAAGIAHLSAANWPVEQLRLCDMPVTAATAAELAKLQLPKLEFISLKGADLTAAAMSGLAKADWLRSRGLDLCNNALDAAAMQHLSKQQLPALKRLCLRCANIAGEGAYWLALGHWPLLTDLDLSMNNLNAKSVEHIASGVWPSLQCLLLDGNPIGGGGAQHLTKGDWPLLQRLEIEHVMLKSPHSAVCLGLDPKWVHSAFPAAVCRGFRVTFLRPTFGMGLWPRLRTVSVHMCPT